MATSGPNQSEAVAEFDDGWVPWTNIGNAITFDQVYATAVIGDETTNSNFVDWTDFGEFTGVGAGDSVTGVTIEVAGKTFATGEVRIISVQLIVGGVVYGDPHNVSGSDPFPTVEGYVSTGVMDVVSDFNTTLNGSQLTSTFGVRLQFQNIATLEVFSVDACRGTLTYTPAASANLNAQQQNQTPDGNF